MFSCRLISFLREASILSNSPLSLSLSFGEVFAWEIDISFLTTMEVWILEERERDREGFY